MTEFISQQGTAAASDEVVSVPAAVRKAPAKKAPAKKAPPKRVRRTNDQIAADEIAELKAKLELAEQRARLAQLEKLEAEEKLPQNTKGKKHTFHFVTDGYSILERTWYRGQELTLVEGSPEWEAACDRFGNFVMNKSDYEQMEAYDGVVFYREGPWPGLPFDPQNFYEPNQVDESGNPVKASADEILALEKANKSYKR